MRALVLVFAACASKPPPVSPAADAATCPAIARHVMQIGPVDNWIAEAREEAMLPIDGVSDREGLLKMFELACRDNWAIAQRHCVSSQPSWADVERACGSDKVWWYEPT